MIFCCCLEQELSECWRHVSITVIDIVIAIVIVIVTATMCALDLAFTIWNSHTLRHPDTQTRRHTDTQTQRHTDTQTHRHRDTEA